MRITRTCAALALLWAAACSKKDEGAPAAGDTSGTAVGTAAGTAAGTSAGTAAPTATTPPTATAKVEEKIEATRAVLKEGEAMTPEIYEQLVLGLADCPVVDMEIDASCAGAKALQDAMNRSQTLTDLAGMSAGVGRKLIGHAAPAVRLKSAHLMASFLGTDASSQDAIAAAAKQERDLGVLKAMIRTVGNDGAKNPEIGELLLWAADHADGGVRTQAVYALSSPWNRELGGGAEKLAALAEGDADPKVRQAACEYAGKLGDDALYPTYAKLTKDTADAALYGACFNGLVTMWTSYPHFDTFSKKSYQLTLDLLEKTPRSKDVPPWNAMGDLGYAGEAKPEWKDKATWFKPADLRKALGAVIADKAANWMARSGAVEAMVKNGATKAELEKLRKGYGDAPAGDDTHVVKKLDEAIAKL